MRVIFSRDGGGTGLRKNPRPTLRADCGRRPRDHRLPPAKPFLTLPLASASFVLCFVFFYPGIEINLFRSWFCIFSSGDRDCGLSTMDDVVALFRVGMHVPARMSQDVPTRLTRWLRRVRRVDARWTIDDHRIDVPCRVALARNFLPTNQLRSACSFMTRWG
ncbi:unnamed protein product [Laminaria digitata]